MKKSFNTLVCALAYVFQTPVMARDGKRNESAHVHHHTTGWVLGDVVNNELSLVGIERVK